MHGLARAFTDPDRSAALEHAVANIIKYFSRNSESLHWENWERSNVSGFRSITPDGFLIEIRKFYWARYGSHNMRWSMYGFNPGSVDHWYYVIIKNTRSPRNGQKLVVDVALLQGDTCYIQVRNFHQRLQQTWRQGPTRPYPVFSRPFRLQLVQACQVATQHAG